MPYLNQVTIMGYLAKDPVLQKTKSGSPVANFTISIKSKELNGRFSVEFFKCEAWGGLAENFCKTARKGALVLIYGRLHQNVWLNRENQKRSVIRIFAHKAFHIEIVRGMSEKSREFLEKESEKEIEEVDLMGNVTPQDLAESQENDRETENT